MHLLELADMYRECAGLYRHLFDFFDAYPGYKEVYIGMYHDLRLLASAIDCVMRDEVEKGGNPLFP